jgi:hypothetical protein
MEAVFGLHRVLRTGYAVVTFATRTRMGGTSSWIDLAARGRRRLRAQGTSSGTTGTRLRLYGYPRVFVPNIAHQHILVLRREDGGRQARRRLSR